MYVRCGSLEPVGGAPREIPLIGLGTFGISFGFL